jgi:hypothetical protein
MLGSDGNGIRLFELLDMGKLELTVFLFFYRHMPNFQEHL